MPFGLKNAPSQFQKAMVTLFQPLLTNALIYVDDILLFSKDEESHGKLLTEFYNLVKSQGKLLSEKKMIIGQSSIDFLGVNISNRKYNLQPHIVVSLGEFPDKLTSAKQIQQFLGIVNYMSNFIPKISKYRNCLAQLLKKSPPRWNSVHTKVVQQLKKIAKKLPLYRFWDQANEYCRQMQVINTGRQLSLKKWMAKEVFMVIKVVHSSL